MRLAVLSAESLGARGLCCRVETADRVIVIDPGVALGAWRHRLPPHPVQIAAGDANRRRIVEALDDATDVVFSHFHGDHVPLRDANPYQLAFSQLPPAFATLRAWSLSPRTQTAASRERAADLMELLGPRFRVAEGIEDGPLRFSPPVDHGEGGESLGEVMMTRVDLDGRAFVHASDIQLLNAETVDFILDWRPHWVLAAGPPLYQQALGPTNVERAFDNAVRLARDVDTLVLDHHLLRSLEGAAWLDRVSSATGRTVYCAADFMGRPRRLLEARRQELYAAMPVRPGWHDDYAHGLTTVDDFAPRRAR
jgi:predicted metallo-beta-lactamase superfamily hydrolase